MEKQENPAVLYIVWYFICGILILIILPIIIILIATPQSFQEFLTTLPGYTTLGPLVLLYVAVLVVFLWPLVYIFIGLFGFLFSIIIPGSSIAAPFCLLIILSSFISVFISEYLLSKRRTSAKKRYRIMKRTRLQD